MVLWPNFGHCTTTINVWERIGEKHLAQVVGEGACQPNIFAKYRSGRELGPCYSWWCYGQILAIAPLTTINVWERIGEKHLAQVVGEGACQPDIFTKYRLGSERSYGTCAISLCAL